MRNDLARFHQTYFDEVDEHLERMEQLLVELNVDAPSRDDLDAIFRAAHSIKGASATFGFEQISAFTHEVESFLDTLREGGGPIARAVIDALLISVDAMRSLAAASRSGSEIDHNLVEQAQAAVRAASGFAQTASVSVGEPSITGMDYGFFDDEEDGEAAGSEFGFFEDVVAETDDEGYGFFNLNEEEQAFGFFENAAGLPGTAAPSKPVVAESERSRKDAGSSSTLRVRVDKVDQLVNLVGEIVVAQSKLLSGADRMATRLDDDLRAAIEQMQRYTRDLRDNVMAIRMVPMSSVFNRFPRMVRELAQDLGKEVELRIIGEDVELDKGLIERIVDPLTHLVRNSIDHGIESPATRSANGKASHGTIVLRAEHRSGNVMVEVSDDGGGLDRNRIAAIARERGITVPDAPSDAEIDRLIFAPGFSTAERVTEVSGRGVGMDVVKRNVEALGGRIEIRSSPGYGTTVTIALPLTLAIVDGISAAVNGSLFVFPIANILESVQPDSAQTVVLSATDGARAVRIRDEYLPIVDLRVLFSHTRNGEKRSPAHEDAGIWVIVESGGARAALVVDALEGQHQVVIKSLETNFRRVENVAGAAVMGDGRIALILDIAAIVRRMHTPVRLTAGASSKAIAV